MQALAADDTQQRDPEDLNPCFMRAFSREALGRCRQAAAECRSIISWLQAHNGTVHTTWPKEKLSKESKPNSEQPTLTPMAPATNRLHAACLRQPPRDLTAHEAADPRRAEETPEDTDLHPGALIQTLPPHNAMTDCPISRRTQLVGQSP